MRIGIVGGGVVGHATARAFIEHAEIRVYDGVPERCTHPLVAGEPDRAVLDCDLIFVCLPEESVEPFFRALLERTDVYPEVVLHRNFVIKSTVQIGTTRRLSTLFPNVVHSPEFLTARCAVTDAQLPARNIVGYPDSVPLDENTAQHPIAELYERRFAGVPLLKMLSDESEAVKLIVNSFFAVKVAYFNEVNTLCTCLGLNWDRVMGGVLSDGRIAHSHTKVPGPDGSYGFGGKCLPKDLGQLIEALYSVGDIAPVTAAARNRNEHDRKREVK